MSIFPDSLNFTLKDTLTIEPSSSKIYPSPSFELLTSTQFSETVIVSTMTAQPTTVSTVISISTTNIIILGSALVAFEIFSIIICITAVIASYKCGKRKQNSSQRERSTTELIANELYKTNSTNITDEGYAELRDLYPVTDDDSYSKLKHNRYTEVEPTYSKIQHETDQKTQAIGVVESSRAYTSLTPVTLDKPSSYDVTSPNSPHPVSSDTSCL